MIDIKLPNGFHIIAEQNTDPVFSDEIFIGITDGNGCWYQDLAIIGRAYEIGDDLTPKFEDEKFNVFVFSDKDNEDYTHKFSVGLYHGGI